MPGKVGGYIFLKAAHSFHQTRRITTLRFDLKALPPRPDLPYHPQSLRLRHIRKPEILFHVRALPAQDCNQALLLLCQSQQNATAFRIRISSAQIPS